MSTNSKKQSTRKSNAQTKLDLSDCPVENIQHQVLLLKTVCRHKPAGVAAQFHRSCAFDDLHESGIEEITAKDFDNFLNYFWNVDRIDEKEQEALKYHLTEREFYLPGCDFGRLMAAKPAPDPPPIFAATPKSHSRRRLNSGGSGGSAEQSKDSTSTPVQRKRVKNQAN